MANRHQKKISVVHWTPGVFQAFGMAAASPVGITAVAAQHLPETLLRTRGSYSATLDGALAPATGVQLSVGLILVPEGTGATVLWSPVADGDAAWIWWDTVTLLYEEAVTDVIASQNSMSAMRMIDSKGMRHVRNQEIQFVAESTTLETASAVNVAGACRFLTGS